MSVKESIMEGISGEFMNPAENKAKDSITPNTVDITVAPSPYAEPKELVINCSKILFIKDGMSITLDGNMDYATLKKIVINGITYERVKERDDRDDPFLKYELGL